MSQSLARPGQMPRATSERGLVRRVAVATLAAALLGILMVPAALAQYGRHWSAAVSVDPARQNGVNTAANDGCPIEAPDGHVLFIATNRVPANGLDIWVAYRTGEDGSWGDPEPLPAPVNTTAQEFCPTPLPGNQLLFVRSPGTCGGPDIHHTRLRMSPLAWTAPVALPCGQINGDYSVNSPFEEFSPSLVQADGRTLLFFSSNRATGIANVHKIYWSEQLADGSWTAAQIVEELSAWGFNDARPNVSANGLEIVFDSNRAGTADVYQATRGSLNSPWSNPNRLGPNVNSDTADESRAALSYDGQRLYFGSTRANAALGGAGGDVYVSTRSGAD